MAKKTSAQLDREISVIASAGVSMIDSATLLPGSEVLWTLAQSTTAARARKLRRWSIADKDALKLVLEYVRRAYKVPGAAFPRLVPIGMGGIPQIVCGDHYIAKFSTFEIAQSAETIARLAAESAGLAV